MYLELGTPPPNWALLTINNTSRHAVPLGPVVKVPLQVKGWKDIETVLSQIEPLQGSDSGHSRPYMFGFLLGVIIGDASKKRQKNWHRHVELVLSKRYHTSVRIGDFTSLCAMNLGLEMNRSRDIETKYRKPNGFFVWRSQSSALVD
ncbi:MAG TPA: hypothetical protein VFE91_05505 [Nitrososphaerales archaeon]|nr:hypothetical protein [Nitrososphaerales archaeon]